MTTTLPRPRAEDETAALGVIEALQTLAEAGWTIAGVAEHEENGVRVRAVFSTSHHPTVGVSRVVKGIRQHLHYDGYLPADPDAAVGHAMDMADVSAQWAVTR